MEEHLSCVAFRINVTVRMAQAYDGWVTWREDVSFIRQRDGHESTWSRLNRWRMWLHEEWWYARHRVVADRAALVAILPRFRAHALRTPAVMLEEFLRWSHHYGIPSYVVPSSEVRRWATRAARPNPYRLQQTARELVTREQAQELRDSPTAEVILGAMMGLALMGTTARPGVPPGRVSSRTLPLIAGLDTIVSERPESAIATPPLRACFRPWWVERGWVHRA